MKFKDIKVGQFVTSVINTGHIYEVMKKHSNRLVTVRPIQVGYTDQRHATTADILEPTRKEI